MKRILALLFSIVLILTALCPSAFATEFNNYIQNTNSAADEEEPENPENPDPEEPQEPEKTNPKSFEELDDNEVVANLYICTKINFLGHVWIYIENTRTLKDTETLEGLSVEEQKAVMSIPVGCFKGGCEMGQGVSVGTAFFTRVDGPGVYYNVEAYMLRNKGTKGIRANKLELTKKELIEVNKKIVSTNEWTPFTNCGLFATKVWNRACDVKGVKNKAAYGVFPFVTALDLGSDKKDVPNMYVPDTNHIYKQRKTGDKAYCEKASKGSLNMPIG